MPRITLTALALSTLTIQGCTQPNTDMTNTTNPLFCDPDTGVCAVPGMDPEAVALEHQPQPPTTTLPSACSAMLFTVPSAPLPGLKLASREPSALIRAMRLRGTPL